MLPVLLGMVCPELQLANARLLLGGLTLPVLMPLDYVRWQWLDHLERSVALARLLHCIQTVA